MGTTRGGWVVLSEYQHTLMRHKRQPTVKLCPSGRLRGTKRKKIRHVLDLQVGVTRFERATSSSRTTRSTKLSYTPGVLKRPLIRENGG